MRARWHDPLVDGQPSARTRTTAQLAGDTAEALVGARLSEAGWTVLARNVHVGRHELDLVAVDPGPPPMLVVVEVRWRRRRDFGLAGGDVRPPQARPSPRRARPAARGRPAGRRRDPDGCRSASTSSWSNRADGRDPPGSATIGTRWLARTLDSKSRQVADGCSPSFPVRGLRDGLESTDSMADGPSRSPLCAVGATLDADSMAERHRRVGAPSAGRTRSAAFGNRHAMVDSAGLGAAACDAGPSNSHPHPAG